MIAALAFALVPLFPQDTGQLPGPRDDPEVRRWVGRLGTKIRSEYYGAIDELAKLKKRAVPYLVPIVADKEQSLQLRLGALEALAQMGPPAAPLVAHADRLFEEDDLRYRWLTLLALEKIGEPARPALPAVRGRRSDESDRIRGLALKVLCQFAKDRKAMLPEVEKELASESSNIRAFALETLQQYYPEGSWELRDAILAQLGHLEVDIRKQANRLLGRMGPKIVPILIERMKTDDRALRAATITALGGVRPVDQAQVDGLIATLLQQWSDETIRNAAQDALRSVAGPCTDELGALLERAETDKAIKVGVMDLLGTIGVPARAQWRPIAALAAGEDPELRRAAIASFLKMGAPDEAFPVLVRALDDSSPEVVRLAVAAIAKLGPGAKPALPRFVEMLASKDPFLSQRVKHAFVVIGEHGLGALPGLMELMEHDDAMIRQRAITSVAAIGKGVLPDLLRVLKESKSARLRRGSIRAMRIIGSGPKEAVAILGEELTSEDPLLRCDAAMTLARLDKDGETAPALMRLLNDSDKDVRIAVVTALGVVGREHDGVIDGLEKAIQDGEEAVAYAAIEALGWRGNHASVDELVALLDHEDEFRRMRAVKALEAIGRAAGPALPKLEKMLREDRSIHVARALEGAIQSIRTGR